MKKFLLQALLIFLSSDFFPQEIHRENFSAGVVFNYLLTDGDLKSYWDNTPEAGFLLNYLIDKHISFEGSITGSYFNPKDENGSALPDIFFINMPAGIKYSPAADKLYSFHLSAGITNSTFIFSGEAAEVLKENNIESEFGFFASAGISRILFADFRLEFSPSLQKVFSSPNLNIFRIGIKVIFSL